MHGYVRAIGSEPGLFPALPVADEPLDLADDAQVIVRPGQREQVGEVRLAEEAEVRVGPRAGRKVPRRRHGGDVLAGQRDDGRTGLGAGFVLLVGCCLVTVLAVSSQVLVRLTHLG